MHFSLAGATPMVGLGWPCSAEQERLRPPRTQMLGSKGKVCQDQSGCHRVRKAASCPRTLGSPASWPLSLLSDTSLHSSIQRMWAMTCRCCVRSPGSGGRPILGVLASLSPLAGPPGALPSKGLRAAQDRVESATSCPGCRRPRGAPA